MSGLVNLQELNLYNNDFKTIPLVIKKLPILKKLDIANNRITVVPAWLDQLKDLEHLQLGNNPIRRFELDPQKCGKLKELYFNKS
jgi:Leucine-rich repeat (LRR) protein